MILKKKKLLDLLSSIENLVALPPTYFEFNKALNKKKSNEEIIKILEKDISISTKILQVSNSVFYSTKKIASIKQAFEYLGLDTIKKIVTIFCYTSAKKLDDTETKNFTTIIKHSVRVNEEFFPSFELRTKKTLSDSFASVGLTHDIGKIIILKYLPDRFNKIVEVIEQNPNEDFFSCEIKLGFKGITHAEIGAYLLDFWNLPQENVNIALYHHSQEAPDSYKQILEIFDDVNFDIEICKFTKMF
jgi:HD-like signal output (HDOD) protein